MATAETQRNSTEYWSEFVAQCAKKPLASWETIDHTVEKMNTVRGTTGCSFILMPVVEGIVGPMVVKDVHVTGGVFRPVAQSENVGPEIQKVLHQLPDSVRNGVNAQHEVWQIRLNASGSYEERMGGTTNLLIILLRDKATGACYFLPEDGDSETNWSILQETYTENFPSLPSGDLR